MTAEQKTESLKLTADTITGVTIGTTNMPESPEVGSLIVTIITIVARIFAERIIEKFRKRKG